MTLDVAETVEEIKFPRSEAHKFWIAMCVDVLDHEVVGMQIPPPAPADKARHSQSPTLVWLWMLKEAAHRERKRLIAGQMVRLRRGQLAVSQRYLAEKANWGRKAVRMFLERLETFDMVSLSKPQDVDQLRLNLEARKLNGIQKGPPLTVVTICNYDKYQHDPVAKGPARAQEGPRRGPGGAQNLTSNKDTEIQKKEVSKRATRLPADWVLPDDCRQWAEINFSPDASAIVQEAECFRDYWVSTAGAKGLKLDWDATWRNWCRKAKPASATLVRRPQQLPAWMQEQQRRNSEAKRVLEAPSKPRLEVVA